MQVNKLGQKKLKEESHDVEHCKDEKMTEEESDESIWVDVFIDVYLQTKG